MSTSSVSKPLLFVIFVIALLTAGLAACNKAPNQAADLANGNPAVGNLAPAGDVGTPEPAASDASQAASPASSVSYNQPAADANYEQPVEATDPPPPLPVYSQPPCPGENYIWTPGYWAYAGVGYNGGYYWVPGAWVLAPWVGALWTPPWWGFDGGVFAWHAGYWGPHIGFYGGIDYGFGYTGRGYFGAYWNHGILDYNRAVTNVNINTVRNVYNYGVPERQMNRVSYNGGRGGIVAQPGAQELAVSRDPRTPAVAAQIQNAREASGNRAQFAAAGRTQPAALVANRPLATSYRAPAAHAPAAAAQAVGRSPLETPARVQTNGRPGAQAARQGVSENRAMRQPAARPQTASRQQAGPFQPQGRAASQGPNVRQQAEPRTAPVGRGAAPQARPGPAAAGAMPERGPQSRAAVAARPAPQARPNPRGAAAPHPAEKGKRGGL